MEHAASSIRKKAIPPMNGATDTVAMGGRRLSFGGRSSAFSILASALAFLPSVFRLRLVLCCLLQAAFCLSPALALDEDTVIAPATSRQPPDAARPVAYDPLQRSIYVVLFLGALAGGAWWLVKIRPQQQLAASSGQNLRIVEIRSLGQRQYLAVAAYGEEKFLLGICPGQISLLTKINQPELPGNK